MRRNSSYGAQCTAVFVLLKTQGTARPMDANPDGSITLMLPKTIHLGNSIIMKGVLNDQSENITVLLHSDDSEDCKIIYTYKDEIMEVTPAVEPYNKADYKITNRNDTFTLELTARLSLSQESPEFNVTFSVDGGVDMGESLYLEVKSFKSLNSITLKEGIKTINTLSFNFTNVPT